MPGHEGPVLLEFLLAPEHRAALTRLPGLAREGPVSAVRLSWHDGEDGALAAEGRVVCREGRRWRLERLRPASGLDWPAVLPPPVLAEAEAPSSLRDVPAALVVVAELRGRATGFTAADGVGVTLLHGRVRAGAASRAVCRVRLAGPGAAVHAEARRLAETLRLGVPRAGLGQEAAELARGLPPEPRHLGAPEVRPGGTAGQCLSEIAGQLTDVMLHWSTPAGRGGTPEPVHQMRVASRRLRSALSLFRRVADCPELRALSPALRDCAARLGAARDWDVFLDGTGAHLGAAFPGDARCAALLRAARARQAAAYAELRAYLASPAFRVLMVDAACFAALRPWEVAAETAWQDEMAAVAATMLRRRYKRVRKAGRGLEALPLPALHELRKDCKRLRYAAEFFATLFPHKPVRRFGRRLAAVQEELGRLNDTAVTAALMSQLGRAGQGFAAGLAEGFAAAAAATVRQDVALAWERFGKAERYWRG